MFRLARSVSCSLGPVVRFVGDLTLDGFHFLAATLRSRTAVSGEILFMRKQLAFYQEHQIRPRPLIRATGMQIAADACIVELSPSAPGCWARCIVVVHLGTVKSWYLILWKHKNSRR